MCAVPAAARDYYVDCGGGQDSADGLTPATAWRTTSAVSKRTFAPGDAILFRRGSTCEGMLAPKGSGTAAAPIRLDAWDTGSLPKIVAKPGEHAALLLSNQEYWTVEHLEFSGGNPHGVFVTGTRGILHGIHIRDIVVHDVTGTPKHKEGGLLVVSPTRQQQRFDDVVIDGVTVYRTSQWVGILVGGGPFGFPPESTRSTHVVVRNSTVSDVAGDGIILFRVNDGVIENSVAGHTGMQETETIGTPNAIWTWMCRRCTVRRSEAFLTDSPGVDGGAFDIDYGNDDNVVEESYGHDTQGYCLAVFGSGWVTTNSIVRNNVCAGNGRSPRLAQRQGAVFLDTWNNGQLKGVSMTGNRVFWNPPIGSAAVVNRAAFVGTGTFEGNTIESSSPFLVRSNTSLLFDHNSYRYSASEPAWEYGGVLYRSFSEYQSQARQDTHSTREKMPAAAARESPPNARLPAAYCDGAGGFTLLAFVSASPEDHDSRGTVTIAESAFRQFHASGLGAAVVVVDSVDPQRAKNLPHDWQTGDMRVRFDGGGQVSHVPAMVLANRQCQVVWRHDVFTAPGDLGLALRSFLGEPDYAQLVTEP